MFQTSYALRIDIGKLKKPIHLIVQTITVSLLHIVEIVVRENAINPAKQTEVNALTVFLHIAFLAA